MKKPQSGRCGLLAAALLTLAVASSLNAATLPSQVLLRPLTPGDKSLYFPANSPIQVSGGLATLPLGSPAYLEVEVDSTIPGANITNVSWSLTSAPLGSLAALTNSPLGSNIPVYEPADRAVYQVAGRKLLVPDQVGQYTVTVSVGISSSGTTTLTKTLTVGTYLGAQTCALCHSGGDFAPNTYDSWTATAHSMIFSNGVNGYLGHYSQSCLPCHTAGYGNPHGATNDNGFYSEMLQTGWVFPAVQTNTVWATVPAALKALGGIQCENCHGPGSQHAYSLGNTNFISKTINSGDCNQCHDAPTHHIKGTEWYNSRHAVVTRDPAGSAGCVICHTGEGFIDRGTTSTNTAYSAIGCQACHEPHGQTIPAGNPHLLRNLNAVTLMNGMTFTNLGNAALCVQCHHARQNATNYVETTAGNSHYGPHHGPQGDMFLGVNGYEYGKTIPSSAHRAAIDDSCVTCHMQATTAGNLDFLKAGGHTWEMSYSVVSTNGVTNVVDKTDVCVQCHGPITTFDFPREDYNGDGVIEGVQTEVQHLMDRLALMLPPVGVAKSSLNIDSTWTKQQLRAAYNYLFVQSDGSKGVHNVAYAVGLLKASIADLTGDANQDGLPDAWQIQYFGSVTNSQAAPSYCAAGDGIPNWLKYTLGLNPLVPGVATADGVVWANGTTLGGGTNTVQIYTAAEVSFNTVPGVSYQLQGVSSLSGGWQNIGSAIIGDGNSHSYVTPTRKNVQQYFRVVHTP